ncbi:hypothetical protein AGR56_09140 [Clostridium sp. DMHC 10]|uniref:XkdQ/YqbQ family protein n=1 Tax=Clostridium sp. DMHC 10 TaxID=747377 RepID=UPI00069D7A96|nr:hypothetical protein [Clostridium sp. DMHC 10]KOF56817.1 hypothetical protein AGR56_09140 [Clostridium sp. DMHC 10]
MYGLYVIYGTEWVNVISKCNNFAWSSDADTLATEFTFDSLLNMEEGTKFAWKNDTRLIIGGTIIKKTQKKFVNSYTGIDYGWYTNKNKTTIQFNNVSASTAINQLMQQFNLRKNVCPIATNINKIYKAQEVSSIIDDILKQATDETGIEYIKEMIEYTLTISKLSDMKIAPKLLFGSDISVDSSIEDMKNKCIIQSNDENDNAIYAISKNDDSIARYGLLQEIQTIDSKNQSQAYQIARNFILKNNKISKTLNLSTKIIDNVEGADDIKANRMINIVLSSFGINDWIRIKSAAHKVNSKGHTVDLTLDF